LSLTEKSHRLSVFCFFCKLDDLVGDVLELVYGRSILGKRNLADSTALLGFGFSFFVLLCRGVCLAQ